MQAVILAAGEGMRMRPLTEHLPKPLLRVGGRPILDHLFASLPGEVDEVILVVRHLGDMIRRYCGDSFHGRRVTYVEGPVGTGPSFLAAKPFVTSERFMILYGDELPSPGDLTRCLEHHSSVLSWEMDDPWNHGVLCMRPDGTIGEILEKPSPAPSTRIAGGVMVVDHRIFAYPPLEGPSGETYLSTMLNQYVQDVPTHPVRAEWDVCGISRPEDIERATRWFHERNIRL